MDQLEHTAPRSTQGESTGHGARLANHHSSQLSDLRAFVARFGRRLRLRDGWLLAQRSLWLAALAAGLVQVVGRIWPLAHLWLWSLVPFGAWFLAAAAISLLWPLPLPRVARRVDVELGLKERLSTALFLERWQEDGLSGPPASLPAFQPALVGRQREDALSTAKTIDPRRSFPLRLRRRPLALAALLLVAALLLAVVPNPMDAILAERAAVAQAAEEQAAKVEELGKDLAAARELTPEEREALVRQLAELAEQLRANRGDREQALADLSRLEEALRQEIDPNASARQAALDALAAQLQALAGTGTGPAGALETLAEGLAEMDAAEREALAQSLAAMAARAAQSGEASLAQAVATMAQAVRSGDGEAAAGAARSAGAALLQAQTDLAAQATLQKACTDVQAGRQAMARAGLGQAGAQGPGQGQGLGQGQGQGQGQPGGGGGTNAAALPPARRSGQAGTPQGEGRPGSTADLQQNVYVPWERRPGAGDQVTITGVEGDQGETQVREVQEPLPGAPGDALVPYHEVYAAYLDAANQAMERTTIPPGLEDLVREYFSRLEP
jgi:hypothetical protein